EDDAAYKCARFVRIEHVGIFLQPDAQGRGRLRGGRQYGECEKTGRGQGSQKLHRSSPFLWRSGFSIRIPVVWNCVWRRLALLGRAPDRAAADFVPPGTKLAQKSARVDSASPSIPDDTTWCRDAALYASRRPCIAGSVTGPPISGNT